MGKGTTSQSQNEKNGKNEFSGNDE